MREHAVVLKMLIEIRPLGSYSYCGDMGFVYAVNIWIRVFKSLKYQDPLYLISGTASTYLT